MKDIAMINGDLVVNDFGDIAIVSSDNDDIIQFANNNILTRLGENIFHTDIGNDVHNRRFKMTQSNLVEIESYCKNAILRDTRIDNIVHMKASIGSNHGECIIEYTLLTVDGDNLDGRMSINIF